MPDKYPEPKGLDEVHPLTKTARAKLEAAMLERSILTYGFSWAKLRAMLDEVLGGATDDEIANLLTPCIVATTADEAEVLRSSLNDTILQGLKDCDLRSIRHNDPFGNPKDFIKMTSSSSSFSKQTAMDILVAEYKLPAKELSVVWDRATTKKPYTVLQVRNVKEKDGEDD